MQNSLKLLIFNLHFPMRASATSLSIANNFLCVLTHIRADSQQLVAVGAKTLFRPSLPRSGHGPIIPLDWSIPTRAPSGWADAGQPSGGDPAGEATGQVANSRNPSLPPHRPTRPPDPPTHIEHPEILQNCHFSFSKFFRLTFPHLLSFR